MKRIKYYDEISEQEIELEVNDEVYNYLIDYEKKEKRDRIEFSKNEFSVDGLAECEDILIDKGDNPLQALIKKEDMQSKYIKREERKKLLKRALNILTYKEKQVIEAALINKESQAEISRKLNISRSAVKQRYDNAMCKIKEFIMNNG